MRAHEQTSPSHESGCLDPRDAEKTEGEEEEEEDITDTKPSMETPDIVKKNSLML